ncbi:MAG: hypothetical protein IJK64_04840, partial [Clostridia bacterium]|nr:hypothetical protein [Clostridia bacterium]
AGDRIPEPEEPIVAGYIFEDWSPAVPLTMPENDLTFTAVLEPITYYATFVADGAQVGEPLPYTVESAGVTPPAVPEKPGYTGAWEAYSLTVGGITVHAVYAEILPPAVYIRNYAATLSVDYKTTVTFTAITANAPDGATVHWLVDGKDAGTGMTFKKKKATADFTVQAELIGSDGRILAVSGVEAVKVNAGFFARLVAFFKQLFGSLPIITHALRGAN